MRKKRIYAALLCVALSLGMSVPCFAEAAVVPGITAEVRKIDDGGTVEVSLKANVPTQSLQGVLTYDNTLLQPISWDGMPVSAGETWGPVGSLSHELAAGKPALVKQAATAKDGYLYLAAETILGNTLPADKNLVTVRFRCLGDAPDQVAAAASVGFVTDAAVAAETPAHDPAVLIRELGEVVVIASPALTVTTGPSAGGGQSAASGDHAIVFFDWDGSVLSAIAAPQDAAAAVAAQQAKLTALKKKAGYAFQGWVPLDGSRTAYNPGEALPAFLDFKNVTQPSVLVQAVYQGTDELHTKADATKNSSYTLDKEKIYYTRYGSGGANDGKYSITVTFSRTYKDGDKTIGVERMEDPGAVVVMSPAGLSELFSFIATDNGETITFEMVPTRDMTKIAFKMVDINGVSAWIDAATRSGSNYEIPASDFIKYGNANYICEQGILKLKHDADSAVEAGNWDTGTGYVDAQAFKDALGGTAVANLDTAKTNILNRLAAIKLAEGEYRVLTYDEFKTALGVSG